MRKGLYSKLALTNIKKNAKTYVPYMLTCVLTVAMFYMIMSLSKNGGIAMLNGRDTIYYILGLGVNVTGIFAVIFLFYTNSFLMKRRKKEFGLYNILGMEKKHISKVVTIETVIIALVSMVLGLIVGMVLDKLSFLLLLRVLNHTAPMDFEVSGNVLITTVVFFAILFFVILLNSLRQIYLSKPIELLKGGEVGEKEPKAKWVLAILGVVCLGAAYYISLTITNPAEALLLFFVAVILVIIGTYLVFTAGSIALLNLLRKNKGYYYKTKHFISVSGMIYRMKQNAVGLANICILCTMVLVMLSSTLSLYLGVEDMVNNRYPRDIVLTSTADYITDIKEQTNAVVKKNSLTEQDILEYSYFSVSAIKEGDSFVSGFYSDDFESIYTLLYLPLEDYNRATGQNYTLNDGEILLASEKSGEYAPNTFKALGETYTIKDKPTKAVENGNVIASIAQNYNVVVKDMQAMNAANIKMREAYREAFERENPNGDFSDYLNSRYFINRYYGFNLETTDDEQELKVYQEIADTLKENELEMTIENRTEGRKDVLLIYGGMFFIGMFLGLLFIMATILIIYYKQVSEGYDDKERFAIMQKVGMSKQEIKKSIGSQVLTVFFLPLITAGVHVAFAFPIITKILEILSLNQTSLFIWCTIGSFLVFALFYAILYGLTARVYYKIVSWE